jgi:hypothetical protein
MRRFDLPTANQLVPFLQRTFHQVRAWSGRCRELSAILEKLEAHDVHAPETLKVRTERDALLENIRGSLEELSDLGVEVKSSEGLVDFRAMRNGQEVYLCWQYGETAISQWHDLDTGFSGRRPIDDSAAFEPSYLS